jgi:uncharacterized protein YlzI (FlbEa/FlbD family)
MDGKKIIDTPAPIKAEPTEADYAITRAKDSIQREIDQLIEDSIAKLQLVNDKKLIKKISSLPDNHIKLLLGKHKSISLAFFPDTEFMLSLVDTVFRKLPYTDEMKINKKWIDFDGDGIDELYLDYFSGGCHCCVYTYVFKKINSHTYRQILSRINDDKLKLNGKKITEHQYSKFGYFFTCFGCGVNEDSLVGEYFFPEATFEMKNGKFYYSAAVDVALNNKIINALIRLQKFPIPTVNDGMDNGTRKLYAKLIAIYYLNNKCNKLLSKKLFFKYYKSSDVKIVWAGLDDLLSDNVEEL